MADGAIRFVEPGAPVDLIDLAGAEFVIGVYPDGHGHVIKQRESDTHDKLSAECVEWLRANPTNRPEDFDD